LQVYTCIHLHAFIYTCMYTSKYTNMCIYIYIFIYVYISIHSFMHICMHICVYFYKRIYIYIHICIYFFIPAPTQRPSKWARNQWFHVRQRATSWDHREAACRRSLRRADRPETATAMGPMVVHTNIYVCMCACVRLER